MITSCISPPMSLLVCDMYACVLLLCLNVIANGLLRNYAKGVIWKAAVKHGCIGGFAIVSMEKLWHILIVGQELILWLDVRCELSPNIILKSFNTIYTMHKC